MSPRGELATVLHESSVDRSDITLLDLPYTTQILSIALPSWCNSLSMAYILTEFAEIPWLWCYLALTRLRNEVLYNPFLTPKTKKTCIFKMY